MAFAEITCFDNVASFLENSDQDIKPVLAYAVAEQRKAQTKFSQVVLLSP